MLRNFQEGHHVRPNAHAALANTGRPHPGARRPLAGAVQQAHRPELTSRPGPQPLSARQAVGVNMRNAQSERAVHELLRHAKDEVRLPTLPFSAYEPGAPGRAPWQKTEDGFGQPWFATEVQHIWVYSHQINKKGDREFTVANPRTGLRVYFTPKGYHDGQFNGVASATGEFGRVYANTLGVVVVVATGGAALEAGAGGLIADYAAPYLTREVATGFAVRAGRDAGIQLVSGFLTNKGSFLDRGGAAITNLNYSSILLAGVLNTEGLELKLPAKLLMATGTAAAGSLVTMSFANKKKYGAFVHGVDLHDSKERNDFLVGVGVSGLLDVGTEFGTGLLAPQVAKIARGVIATSAGRAVPATLRAVRAARFALPLSFGIGTVAETGKKDWENRKEAKEKAEEEARERSEAVPRKRPATGHHPTK